MECYLRYLRKILIMAVPLCLTAPYGALSDEAFRVEVKGVEKKLSLYGKCENLEQTVRKFISASPEKRESLSYSIKNKGNSCSVKLSEVLPPVFSKFSWDGGDDANCWGFVSAFLKIIPEIRNMESFEFEFWLKSPLCEKVSQPRAGDIGAIDLPNYYQLHAFIYITPRFRFSKHGPGGPLVFEDVKEPIAYMNRHVRLSYFRCQSIEEYFSKKPPISKSLIRLGSKLNRMVSSYTSFVANVVYRDETKYFFNEKIYEMIDAMDKSLRSFVVKSNEDLVFRKFLRVRLAELRRNMTYVEYWKLFNNIYHQIMVGSTTDSKSTKSYIINELTVLLGEKFLINHNMKERLVVKGFEASAKQISAGVILDTMNLPSKSLEMIVAALKSLSPHRLKLKYFLPISYKGWVERVLQRYRWRKNDLKSGDSPYNISM